MNYYHGNFKCVKCPSVVKQNAQFNWSGLSLTGGQIMSHDADLTFDPVVSRYTQTITPLFCLFFYFVVSLSSSTRQSVAFHQTAAFDHQRGAVLAWATKRRPRAPQHGFRRCARNMMCL